MHINAPAFEFQNKKAELLSGVTSATNNVGAGG
jgi:hypothetical protein